MYVLQQSNNFYLSFKGNSYGNQMMKDAPAEQDAEFNESQFWLSIKLQGLDWDDVLFIPE